MKLPTNTPISSYKATIRRTIRSFFRLFFPHRCLICGGAPISEEDFLCFSCLQNLPRTFDEERQKEICSFLYYSSKNPTQRLIHALKYEGHKEVGFWLGQWAAKKLLQAGHPCCLCDVLIPVPIHPKRLRERGYNQAEWIARGIQSVWNIPIDTNTLRRIHFQKSQTYAGLHGRWENVKGNFALHKTAVCAGKNILLVDDVITTGATASTCVQTLSKIPGTTILIFTAACAKHL